MRAPRSSASILARDVGAEPPRVLGPGLSIAASLCSDQMSNVIERDGAHADADLAQPGLGANSIVALPSTSGPPWLAEDHRFGLTSRRTYRRNGPCLKTPLRARPAGCRWAPATGPGVGELTASSPRREVFPSSSRASRASCAAAGAPPPPAPATISRLPRASVLRACSRDRRGVRARQSRPPLPSRDDERGQHEHERRRAPAAPATTTMRLWSAASFLSATALGAAPSIHRGDAADVAARRGRRGERAGDPRRRREADREPRRRRWRGQDPRASPRGARGRSRVERGVELLRALESPVGHLREELLHDRRDARIDRRADLRAAGRGSPRARAA